MENLTDSKKMTYSLCPVCLARIPAALVLRDGEWHMEKFCDQHGKFTSVVWRGTAPSLMEWGNYRPPEEKEDELPDCPNDCGLCEKHLQSTCCVLVEITARCNLRCPVCFAQSGDLELKKEKTVEELYEDFLFLVQKGCRFIQLSGGEPTVRDDLPEIVAAAKRAGATSVQLNSNGLRLGVEPEFTKRLGKAGLDFVFLQFDGMDDEVYKALRGRPLLEEKLAAISVCGKEGIGVTLVPTVVPKVNDHQIGAVLRFGMENSPYVRGVHYQPISYFGRFPEPPKDEDRITLPEIIAAIEQQTDGLVCQADLAPSSCDHPRCGFHGDFVVMPDKLISLTPKAEAPASPECCCAPASSECCAPAASECCCAPAETSSDACCEPEPSSQCCCGSESKSTDSEALRNRNFVARRWKRNLELEREAETGCCTDMTDFDTFLARVAANGFTVTAMAFQDAYNLDIERLRRCSLHVYDDGRIVPFCAKYLTSI